MLLDTSFTIFVDLKKWLYHYLDNRGRKDTALCLKCARTGYKGLLMQTLGSRVVYKLHLRWYYTNENSYVDLDRSLRKIKKTQIKFVMNVHGNLS